MKHEPERKKIKLSIELFLSFLLTFGLIGGLVLVGQNQDLRKKAAGNSWTIYNNVPIMRPGGGTEGDNIYAPDVHKEGNAWKMWYGGQGSDIHDRIHYAESSDGINWDKKGMVLDDDNGEFHVNDPSVVNVNGTYYMFYTNNPNDIKEDRIDLATSTDGIHWIKQGRVLDVGGTWDNIIVSRPSVIYENGTFKMWFDTLSNNPNYSGHRWIGYATSTDGKHFTKHPNPVGEGGAVDVKHIGDKYILVHENPEGTRWSIGDSETSFVDQGLLIPKSGGQDDKYGQVTPMIYVENGQWTRIYFGGASHKCWCHNRIFMATIDSGSSNPVTGDFNQTLSTNTENSCKNLRGFVYDPDHNPVRIDFWMYTPDLNPESANNSDLPESIQLGSVTAAGDYGYSFDINASAALRGKQYFFAGKPRDVTAVAIDTDSDGNRTGASQLPVKTNDQINNSKHVITFTCNALLPPSPAPSPTPTPQVSPSPNPARLIGDLDGNGKVDLDDFTLFVADFGTRMPKSGSPADFDQDGDVDVDDYTIFVHNYGRSR